MASAPLAARLSETAGPLFFPVTAFGPDGAVDLDVGEVRTPLTEPPAAHVKDLIEIIASGRALLEEHEAEQGAAGQGPGEQRAAGERA